MLYLTVTIFVVMGILSPKPINWNESYSKNDKIPYGAYALHDLMQEAFSQKFVVTETTPYVFLSKSKYKENANYVFINSKVQLGKVSMNRLLQFVDEGGTAFISSEIFEKKLQDTLKIKANQQLLFENHNPVIQLYNNNLKSEAKYQVDKSTILSYFDLEKDQNITVLGKYSDGKPNFIRKKIGKGHIYLHSTPKAFTNYFILKDKNYKYTFHALSYLKNRQIIWDEHYKASRKKKGSLSFIKTNAALEWAYYLAIIGIGIFIYFEGKRKQRVIPVLKAPENLTVDFVKTVGKIYYQNGDNRDLALKKFSFFLEYLRENFYIKTYNLNQEFVEKLVQKTNLEKIRIQQLINKHNEIRLSQSLKADDLVKFNAEIEEIYEFLNKKKY